MQLSFFKKLDFSYPHQTFDVVIAVLLPVCLRVQTACLFCEKCLWCCGAFGSTGPYAQNAAFRSHFYSMATARVISPQKASSLRRTRALLRQTPISLTIGGTAQVIKNRSLIKGTRNNCALALFSWSRNIRRLFVFRGLRQTNEPLSNDIESNGISLAGAINALFSPSLHQPSVLILCHHTNW